MANCSHLFVTWLILARERETGKRVTMLVSDRTFLMNITGIDWVAGLIVECGRSIAILREFGSIETSSRSSCRTPTNTIGAFFESREHRCFTDRHRTQIDLTFSSSDTFVAFEPFFLLGNDLFLPSFELQEFLMPCLLLLGNLFEFKALLPFSLEPCRCPFRFVRCPPALSIAFLSRIQLW